MRRIFVFLTIIILTPSLSAQINRFGIPTMKNYSAQITMGSEYNWSIVKDKTGVVYIGNDNKGILRYDGHLWTKIPVRKDPIIRSMSISDDGVIYVGGSYEFGYIEPDKKGSPRYVSLSQHFDVHDTDTIASQDAKGVKKQGNITIGEIFSTVIVDSTVYFVSTESMFIYNSSNDSIEYINLRDFDLIQVVKVVKIGNRIIMSDNINGLFEFKDKKPVRIPGGEFFAMKISLVILPYDENSLFIGTLTDGVYRLDITTGKVSGSIINESLNERLKSDQLYTAITTPSGEKILGTIAEGIFVLDKNYSLIAEWNTETTDMADNTVTSLYLGNDPGAELWIATAGYVTKAYIGQPFYEISTRTGFEGLVNVLTYFDNRMYLTTDLGLFRSYTNKEGLFSFERIGNINKQVFTITVGEAGNEKFVLAGSNQGLFQITRDGRVIKVDDIMKYPPDSKIVGFNVRSLLQSKVNPGRFYMGLNTKGILISDYNGISWTFIRQVKAKIRGYVSSIVENSKGDLVLFTGNPVGLFRIAANDTIPYEFTPDDGLSYALPTSLSKIGDEIVITTTKGLFRLDQESNKWLSYDELLGGYTHDLYCKDISVDNEGNFWLAVQDERNYEIFFKKDSLSLTPVRGPLNTLPNLDKFDLKYIDGKYWMTKSKVLYVIDKERLTIKQPGINVVLSKIKLGSDSVMMDGSFYETLNDGKNVPSLRAGHNDIPEIKYVYNSVSFFWTLPYFIDEESTLFCFKLDGFDKSWSKWEKIYYRDFTNLPFGKYTFRVKAKTASDIVSKEAVFEFYILKPWYLKGYMILLYAIAAALFILLIIKAYTRKLKNENLRLEGIVAERTKVVVKQKDELESSIHYASRIQMALLPSEAILSENLKNYFILFKPRDIVSGDFYWMTKKGDRLYIVAADCTGHGVPGAFMSLLGMSFLDEIIDKEKAPRADQILSQLRLHVTESLKQSGSDNEAKDGMDMSLLVIDFNVSRIEFSGAYNPCFRIRKLTEEEIRTHKEGISEPMEGSMSNGKYLLETIFASKMPIGISSRMDEKFVFFDWTLEKGVSYYLFSDGYVDQFGGQKGRKFMKKNFKRLLLEIQDYPMAKQKELLDRNLKDWMGKSPQIDDILVMGIRTD